MCRCEVGAGGDTMPGMSRATLFQINMSAGGVPKLPVGAAEVTAVGLVGDAHDDRKNHGGPERALCVFSLEVIRRLQTEGHPIEPGTTGENLTIQGLDWDGVRPGARLRFEGGVVLEVVAYTTPCSTIRGSFAGANFKRIKQELNPGESRVYACVLVGGRLRRMEAVALEPGGGGGL
jgi:MOSC domain-containing protein YiiM